MKQLILILLLLPSVLFAQSNRGIFHSMNNNATDTTTPPPTFDTDAQAFFTSTGITDSATKKHVDSLVKDLKGAGLWSKGKVINPVVGGTATTHKFNLKDPRDLDTAYRLTFTGTVTHSSNGMIGSSAYGNTYFNPNTVYPTGIMSIGVYLRTNIDGAYADIGAISATNKYTHIFSKLSNTFYGQVNTNNSISENVLNNTTSVGWYYAARTASTTTKLQKNATITNSASTTMASTNANIYVMAQNSSGSAIDYSARQIAFIWIGDALTDVESANLYTIIQRYQTFMGRNL